MRAYEGGPRRTRDVFESLILFFFIFFSSPPLIFLPIFFLSSLLLVRETPRSLLMADLSSDMYEFIYFFSLSSFFLIRITSTDPIIDYNYTARIFMQNECFLNVKENLNRNMFYFLNNITLYYIFCRFFSTLNICIIFLFRYF